MSDKTLRRDALGTFTAQSDGQYEGRVARVHAPGDPLVYMRPRTDGTIARVEEYRDAAELAHMVEQLPGKPIIVLHPKNKKNLKRGGQAKIIGRVGEARVDGEYASAKLNFDGPDGPRAIARGIRELSLGYDVDHLDEQGYQRGTEIDHLALVPRARCGPTCDVVRVDCEDDGDVELCACQSDNLDNDLTAAERHHMPAAEFADPATRQEPLENSSHVRDAMSRFGGTHFPTADAKKSAYHHILSRAHALGIDASNFEKEWSGRLDGQCSCAGACNYRATCHGGQENVMSDLAKQLSDALKDAEVQRVRADQAEKDRDGQKARADQAEKDRDAARLDAHDAKKSLSAEKTRADQAEESAKKVVEKARQDADADFDKRVNARVELVAAATPIIGKNDKGETVDLSKMTDRAIQVAVVQRIDGEDLADSETDQFVAGMYKSALKRAGRAAGSRADARTAIERPRQDARPVTPQNREDGGRALMAAIAASASKPRN